MVSQESRTAKSEHQLGGTYPRGACVMMPDLRFFSRRGIKSASSPCASPSLRLMARMRTRSSKILPSVTIESRLHFSRSKTFKRSSWALERSDFNLTSFSIVCVSVRRVLRTVFTSLLLKHTYGLSFVMSCCYRYTNISVSLKAQIVTCDWLTSSCGLMFFPPALMRRVLQ